MATGWIYHETKRRFRNLVEIAGLFDDLVPLKPRMATVDEILRFHTPAYVESIRAMSEASGGNAGELTPFGPGSFEIALLAAGGTITAIDAVLEGRVRNAYALVWPPGHHAEADRGRGFCIFGNVVVAIAHARARQRHSEGLLPRPSSSHHLDPSGSVVPSRFGRHRGAG